MSDKLTVVIYVDDVLVYARDSGDIDDLTEKLQSFFVGKAQQKDTLESRLKGTAARPPYLSQV